MPLARLAACRPFAAVLFVTLTIFLPASAARAQKSPADELKALQVPDDMEIALYASEPMITNPAAIDVDTQGRVWVAEIQWYRRAAKDPPADKIKVLEDTDGDGRADKVSVFAEGLFAPMSITVAGSKVYVATSPDLWVFEDKDGDLKADGPPEKLLTGFGGYNHDHGAHSIVLGPDHKWWMAHGDTGYKVTGKDGSQIEYNAGGMIRGELDGTKLENVAVNFRNPYEIAVNSFGEAFCSDNDNDGNRSVRICWILEGGNYGWYRRPGPKFPPGTAFGDTWHFRGAIPGFVPGTLVTGFGSPCGMCYYEGDAFAKLKDMPLHCDAGPREVRAYPHHKVGAGYKAESRNLVTSQDDNYFRPDDICAMPDGSLVVSDWYDGGVGGHAYNNPDQGRIFRLTPKGKQLARKEKPGPYANVDDAIVGLQSPNLATQFLAREKLLASGREAIAKLEHLVESGDDDAKARALWVLDRIGGTGRTMVENQLDSKDPSFQALAVRILRRHTDDAAINERLMKMATSIASPDPEVWRELLLFLAKKQGLEADAAVTRLAGLIPGNDRYAVETVNIAAQGRKAKIEAAIVGDANRRAETFDLLPVLASDRAEIVEGLVMTFALANKSDEFRKVLVDRIGVTLHAKALAAMTGLATDSEASKDLRMRAIEWLSFNCAPTGLWSGIVGPADPSVSAWTDYKPPEGFKAREKLVAAAKKLLAEPDYQGATLGLVQAAGLSELGPEILDLVTRLDTTPGVRDQAIQVAVATRPAGVAEAFTRLLESKDEGLRNKAAAALVDTQQWNTVKKLVGAGADPKQVREIVGRMMNTTGGALVLLKWVDAKQLDAAAQKLAIERAVKHPDANVRVLFEKFIPEGERPQRLGAAIKAEDILKLVGNPERGAAIFNQSSAAQCKNCHQVHGFGKRLGPDLTTIGKKYEKGALLETILDPSKAISHEFVTYVVETDDGQSLTGFVEKNDKFVTVRTADDKTVRIPTKSVESLTPSPKSMMPELVLRDVTAQDAADLLAYLMTLREPLPQK